MEVAHRVFEWSKSEGFTDFHPPHAPSVGPGLWSSTPPNFPAAVNPCASKYRLLVAGSADCAAQPPPPPNSTNASSDCKIYLQYCTANYIDTECFGPYNLACSLQHSRACGISFRAFNDWISGNENANERLWGKFSLCGPYV